MKYFLGLSSTYKFADTLRHTFASGSEYDLSELRAFLAAHYGATYDHVAVYANGRTALSVAVKAIVERGSKVVVTSLTCYAVVQAIKAAGCIPVFADVDPKTLHFGKAELEKVLKNEDKVRAVIVQNNLGIPADIVGIEEVAKAHKLSIIEDLAHCTGVRYTDGREVGTVGRAAVLSFGKGKSIDTITGGAVIFTSPLDMPVEQPETPPIFKENFRARMYPLFAMLIRGCYYIHPKVGKYLTATLLQIHAIKRSADGIVNTKTRLSFWQCKLALAQLKSMPHSGRKPLRDFYLVENREVLLKKLAEIGYYFEDIWYTLPVAPERYFKKADFHPEECPVAVKLADQIVNVPTHYNPAEMKPALRLIKKYLIEKEEQKSEDELFAEELLTESEKKAKIRAEKAERSKAKKAAKKDIADKKEQANAAAKVVKGAAKAVKEAAKVAKEAAKKTEKVKKKEFKKKLKTDAAPDEDLAALEQTSDLLADKPTPKEQPAEPKEQPLEPKEEEPKTVKATEADKNEAAVVKSEVSPKPAPSPTMRQAPRKLTDREKLKLELEKGKKEGPSVI